MIKSAIFTIAAATTISHSVSGAFDTVRASANDVANVYAIAGQLLDIDYSTGNINPSAEQALYKAASKLEPLAHFTPDGHLTL